MGILNADHPDIEQFVNAKQKSGVLRNFNLSVGISDVFMDAVNQNESWPLFNPHTKEKSSKINAVKLWKKIVNAAWNTGDPGLVFLDTINEANPLPVMGKLMATNPCGEIPLFPYEPCNLGSVNLSKMIQYINRRVEINWSLLEDVVYTAIRFLDDVIEVNQYTSPEIKKMAFGNRKIGLGVMGWAEFLVLLEIPYASLKAVQLAKKIMHFIQDTSRKASVQLADERGVFTNWEKSIYFPGTPIRNATRTAIAPTGTISIIADTSSSIEPFFALAFERENILSRRKMYTENELFLQYLRNNRLFSVSIYNQLTKDGISSKIKGLPAFVKKLFKTALEISPLWHIRHQAAFQKYTDNAVSKTINLPDTITAEEVSKLFMTAWKMKLKGITVFRIHKRAKQVIYPGRKSSLMQCFTCNK